MSSHIAVTNVYSYEVVVPVEPSKEDLENPEELTKTFITTPGGTFQEVTNLVLLRSTTAPCWCEKNTFHTNKEYIPNYSTQGWWDYLKSFVVS